MRDIETIYLGECEHLHCGDIQSSQCLKRYLRVFNWQMFKEVKVVICNQYLRLKINELMNEDNNRFGLSSWQVKRLITDMIRNEFNDNSFGSYGRHGGNSIPENVTFTVCERPFIYQTKTIFEMTDAFISMQEDYSWILSQIHESYLQVLKDYCNYHLKYAKYKKHHKNLKKLLNQLDNPYSFKWKIKELTELFNELLILKTNKL